MVKRTYVVQSENGGFWCGLNSWDVQLRKAQIFHSLKYAGDVVRRFNQYNCKIVEVSLTIVPKAKTNADRIRSMSDEEFSCFLASVENRKTDGPTFCDTSDFWLDWLKQPWKENDYEVHRVPGLSRMQQDE